MKNNKYLGNIDALNVLTSTKQKIKETLLEKLQAAIDGGYMPAAADHSVPGNVSGENYDYFVKLLNEYGKYPLKI